MKKKGFTLVELLAVIAIIAILCLIVVPKIMSVITTNQEKLYKEQETRLKDAAIKYINEEYIDLETTENVKINKTDLITKGYISEIYDLKDKTKICSGYVIITSINTIPSSTSYISCQNYKTENYDYYSSLTPQYITSGLILRYDGINNTGTNHSTTTTTWKDLSGNNYNGTINGATWGNTFLFFDGVNDWVSIAQLNYANPTIEIVFNVNNNGYMIGNWESGGGGLLIRNTFLTGEFYISENSAYTTINSGTNSIVIDTIYTAVLLYDGSLIKLYKNNVLVSSTSVTGTIGIPASNTIMVLGANPTGSSVTGQYLNGNIYSVRIYNRALTDAEVLNNYKLDKLRFDM